MDDIFLADEVHWPDQLHAAKMNAVELRHHGLDLAGIEHAHQVRLDYVIVVMAERDLVAAKLLCFLIKIAAAHAGTQIARGFVHVVDGLKDLCFEDRDRNAEGVCILLDDQAVFAVVAGIHDKEHKIERKFVVTLQFLKKLRHQHGILSTGDAHGDFVIRLDKLILTDGFCKTGKQNPAEFAPDTVLDLLLAGKTISFAIIRRLKLLFLFHGKEKPAVVTVLQASRVQPALLKLCGKLQTENTSGAVENDAF